jgi:recombination protein RecT
MIKKTVIKRAYKLWPKTERLDEAMNHLNQSNGEGLAQDRPDDWVDVTPMIAAALRTKTDVEALGYWKANNAALAKQPADHARLKEEIARHRDALRHAAEEARTVDVEATPVADAAPAMSAEDADFQRTAGAAA